MRRKRIRWKEEKEDEDEIEGREGGGREGDGRSLQDVPEADLTEYQLAARFGSSGEYDCQYEYPCLVQPLDLLVYIYDYWYGDDSL
ncbi:hypothetical protein Pcinc_036583 [Petrolisthes cinctipes]|uniref:Uncharacterized protein n=1 Tax=Petrolisthes cinctipes TaxID=88211 RepID=A0AAE1ELT8_PETCI|nr:hypothetical protein Pcinc_036583 [Petrolisthes cinctipes]